MGSTMHGTLPADLEASLGPMLVMENDDDYEGASDLSSATIMLFVWSGRSSWTYHSTTYILFAKIMGNHETSHLWDTRRIGRLVGWKIWLEELNWLQARH